MPLAGLYGEFLLHAQCWFIWVVSLTHPMLASFLGSFSHKVFASFQKKKNKCKSEQKCT